MTPRLILFRSFFQNILSKRILIVTKVFLHVFCLSHCFKFLLDKGSSFLDRKQTLFDFLFKLLVEIRNGFRNGFYWRFRECFINWRLSWKLIRWSTWSQCSKLRIRSTPTHRRIREVRSGLLQEGLRLWTHNNFNLSSVEPRFKI